MAFNSIFGCCRLPPGELQRLSSLCPVPKLETMLDLCPRGSEWARGRLEPRVWAQPRTSVSIERGEQAALPTPDREGNGPSVPPGPAPAPWGGWDGCAGFSIPRIQPVWGPGAPAGENIHFSPIRNFHIQFSPSLPQQGGTFFPIVRRHQLLFQLLSLPHLGNKAARSSTSIASALGSGESPLPRGAG